MAGRCCVKRGSIAFAKSQLTMIGLLFASGASSSSSSPSSSHGNHASKWHLVTRLLGLPLYAAADAEKISEYVLGLEQKREISQTQEATAVKEQIPHGERTYLTVPYDERHEAKAI